jgi:hypothetical protein
MFLNMMQDWAGWLLLLFSFSIVLMWKRVRSDTKLVHAIWFCIFLHHVVVLLNVYVCTIIGAEGDARSFHFFGAETAVSSEPLRVFLANPSVAYSNFLAFFYRTFGTSFFFGGELSVLAFTLSCVVLVKLVDLLDLRNFSVGIILLFGLLPSAMIFRSVTLRESWQALFFLLSVYFAIRLRKRASILIFSFMLMSAFCMALLHNGLKVYGMYLVLISIYWGILCSKKGVYLVRPIRFLVAGLLIICVIMLTQNMGWHVPMTVGDILESTESQRQSAATIIGRTTYGSDLNTSSVLGFVKTTPKTFIQYMFNPFPWKVRNILDVYALLESMLRFVLLFFAVYSWRRFSGEVRSCYGFLLIVVLCMEFMWALGTVNWGTAIRHHVPGYSVIVLLGVPGWILFMQRLHLKMFGRRKDNTMLPK